MRCHIILVVLIGCLALTAGLSVAARAQEPVELDLNTPNVSLNQNTSFYEDRNSNLSISGILELSAQGAFSPVTGPAINFGSTGYTYWLKIPLRQTGSDQQKWILNLGHVRMADYAAYLLRGNELEKLADVTGGDAASERQVDHRLLLAAFTLRAGEEATLFVKYRSYGNSFVTPTLSTPVAFYTSDSASVMFLSFIFGAIILLAVYNFVIAIMLKSTAHMGYVVFVVAGLMHVFHQAGFAFMLLWPDAPRWNSVAADYLGLITVVAAILFTRRFLDLEKSDRPIGIIGFILIGLTMVTAIWCFIDRPFFIGQVGYALGGLVTILNLTATIRAYRRGHKAARFAIAGWGSMLLVLGYGVLSVLGFLPVPADTNWITGTGLILEGFFFSISLADQVTEIRLSRDKVQQELIGSLEAQAEASNRAVAEAEEKNAAMAEAAAKGRVLSAVGHDVRQPLHALRLYTRGIRNKSASSHTLQGLEYMEQTITSLEQLLNSVMDSAVPESSGDVLVEERFSADRILASLKLIFAPLASEKGIEFRVCPSSHMLCGDRAVIMRIMNNLVSNAVKYTDEGKVLIGCKKRGDKIALQVFDTGCGIPEKLIDTIFGPYNRLNPSETGADGYGLGLAIVRRLSDRIGSEINVQSVPGKGTQFELLVHTDTALEHAETGPADQPLSGEQAIIIDDNPMTLAELEAFLKVFGMDVMAGSDFDAIKAGLGGHACQPSVIISDLHLDNGRSGLGEIDKIRAHFNAKIPAFIVTFDRQAATRDMLSKRSDAALLYKPLDEKVLRARLMETLSVSVT